MTWDHSFPIHDNKNPECCSLDIIILFLPNTSTRKKNKNKNKNKKLALAALPDSPEVSDPNLSWTEPVEVPHACKLVAPTIRAPTDTHLATMTPASLAHPG
jgi:hypothetical protein